MDTRTSLIAGIGIGALAMFLLDPDRGRRRRAEVGQRFTRLGHLAGEAAEATIRDTRNRLIGLWHEAAARFSPEDVSDEALAARIRAAMGRHVTHPGAIDVDVVDGRAILRGDVPANEVEDLINCVRGVSSVQGVTNELVVHDDSAGVPGLQGEGSLPDSPGFAELRPAAALAVGLAGIGLALYGATRHSPAGGALSAVGAGLTMKGLKDMQGTHKYGKQNQAA